MTDKDAIDDVLEETWELFPPTETTIVVISELPPDLRELVARVPYSPRGTTFEEAHARARVAAKAPELYRALAAIIEAWDIPDTGWDIVTWPIEDARKVLAAVREAAGD